MVDYYQMVNYRKDIIYQNVQNNLTGNFTAIIMEKDKEKIVGDYEKVNVNLLVFIKVVYIAVYKDVKNVKEITDIEEDQKVDNLNRFERVEII